jgi:serine/threonine protein kinase
MPTLEPGHAFERYRVIRWLGSGVSGESYEAEDSMLMRKVTLKLIQPQSTLPDSARRQFFRELQGTSALNHPYLAPILDYGELNGRLYIARKFVSSGSLLGAEGRLWFRPPLNETDAIHYAHQLAQALNYIHSRGYVHGAITFSNILLLRGPNLNNEIDYAPFLLADVGLANFARRFGQEQKSPLPITAAPEQFGKRITSASDQFALAVLLYFWLAGRPPYLGTPAEIEQLKLSEAVTPLTSLNPLITLAQSGILLRALSVYPEDRYPSVLAFADALLKTLPPIIPTIPKTEPAQFDGHATPSSVPASGEREHELVLAASPVSEEPTRTARDFDREPYVTPVLANDGEPSPAAATSPSEKPAPLTPFRPIPETDPAIDFEIEPAEVATHFEDGGDQARLPESNEAEQAPGEPESAPEMLMELPAYSGDEPSTLELQEAQPAQINSEDAAGNGHYYSPIGQDSLPEYERVETNTDQPLHTGETQTATATRVARVIITSPYVDEPYEVKLDHDTFSIGRAGDSSILLDQDNLTSRHHALLKREDNRYLLFDMRSANGVFVNGQKIMVESEYELLDGDHISIGNYELIFRSCAPGREREATPDQLTPHAGYELSQLL